MGDGCLGAPLSCAPHTHTSLSCAPHTHTHTSVLCPPHTHSSLNTNVRNLIWKKNCISRIWLSVCGASPSVAAAMIISNQSSRRDSGVPGGCHIAGIVGTDPHRALLPHPHPLPCWPTGEGVDRTQGVCPDQAAPLMVTPEGLSFPMILASLLPI